MHSTKSEILSLLKRADGSTVDDIASHLTLAPMTVRQHLMALERDGLVRTQEVRRQTGRPHYLYRLTDNGHRSVSDGHDRMLALLVEHAGVLEPNGATSPHDRRTRLFHASAEALAERHRGDVLGLSLDLQVERAAEILRSHGGFTDWHAVEAGFEIRDFSCVFRETVSRDGRCEWHETFLSSILHVEITTPEGPADCAVCCRYVIVARATEPALTRGAR